MSSVLVLDAEAFSVLASSRSSRSQLEVRAAMRAAARLKRDVVITNVTLAELYRGPKRNQLVDACLSRETGISTRDTDRRFAKAVGGLLAAAGLGSEQIADAHVVAAGLEAGRALILTGDPRDLNQLAAPYPNLTVRALP